MINSLLILRRNITKFDARIKNHAAQLVLGLRFDGPDNFSSAFYIMLHIQKIKLELDFGRGSLDC